MLMVLPVCACFGCASLGTYNSAAGRDEFIFISIPEEVALGNDVHQKLQSEFEFSDQTAQGERLRRIGGRVARVSDRQDEYESDRLGIKYLRAAGYDPMASIATLEILQKESKDAAGGPTVLRSHPHLLDRIEGVKKEIELPRGQ